MFRFTIRDVLWLTLVVGLGLGWWADRAQLNSWHKLRFGSLVRDVERHLITTSGDTVIIDEHNPPVILSKKD